MIWIPGCNFTKTIWNRYYYYTQFKDRNNWALKVKLLVWAHTVEGGNALNNYNKKLRHKKYRSKIHHRLLLMSVIDTVVTTLPSRHICIVTSQCKTLLLKAHNLTHALLYQVSDCWVLNKLESRKRWDIKFFASSMSKEYKITVSSLIDHSTWQVSPLPIFKSVHLPKNFSFPNPRCSYGSLNCMDIFWEVSR